MRFREEIMTTLETQKQPSQLIKPCTIILAEDNQDDRMLAMQKFKKSNLVKDVVAVPDGMKLIDYMKKEGFYDHSIICFTPMVIVIDLQMPNKDGFEILADIKSDNFLKEIPVIVLSSLKTDESVSKAFRLGADGFLKKPLEMKRLESLLCMGWQWPPAELW
jgi:two-component system response regulator